jgi:hypothetical protein
MADFLGGGGNDIDEFERATSAFPDISLDGSGDIPSVPAGTNSHNGGGFSFDDFEIPSGPAVGAVKVTGDDEIEKFENEFPEIEVAPPVPMQVRPQQLLCWRFADDDFCALCSHNLGSLHSRVLRLLHRYHSLLGLLLRRSYLRLLRRSRK